MIFTHTIIQAMTYIEGIGVKMMKNKPNIYFTHDNIILLNTALNYHTDRIFQEKLP